MKDLFGDEIIENDKVMELLREIDEESLLIRSENLRYINEISRECIFSASAAESIYVYWEAKQAFINRCYIPTIILSQSFIEHRLQFFMKEIGKDKISESGLNAIIDFLLTNRPKYKFIYRSSDLI